VCDMFFMPRQVRVEYEGAVYHVMARGKLLTVSIAPSTSHYAQLAAFGAGCRARSIPSLCTLLESKIFGGIQSYNDSNGINPRRH
jgi:hypothetical protein